jgi:uncharacterized membrane protein
MAAAIGIGAIAGLRSMTAPAVVSWATEQRWIDSPTRPLRLLKTRKSVAIATALAIGELVVDKLPITPNRTEPFSLAARAVSGGLAAGALCASRERLVIAGALLGSVAAIAGAFAGYQVRRQLREKLGWNGNVLAVAEDALAVGGGLLLVRSA